MGLSLKCINGIAVFIILILTCNTAYSQLHVNTTVPEADERLGSLIARAKFYNKIPLGDVLLNGTLRDIGDVMLNASPSADAKRDATKELAKMFSSLDDSLTGSANKIRIIEAIGRSDNSLEAHEFFLRILESDNTQYRNSALWSMTPSGLHGDDLYERIKVLFERGALNRVESLMYFKSANKSRALGEIQEFLRTTSVRLKLKTHLSALTLQAVKPDLV